MHCHVDPLVYVKPVVHSVITMGLHSFLQNWQRPAAAVLSSVAYFRDHRTRDYRGLQNRHGLWLYWVSTGKDEGSNVKKTPETTITTHLIL